VREKPRIGVSACLLGQKVRYDGQHKRVDWLVEELGKWVSFHPVCPELEMGLGAPRESMRLVRRGARGRLRLLGNDTDRDFTDPAERTARRLVEDLPDLDGYVLKKNSPSCGLERVKVYDANQVPARAGQGFFATALQESRPGLPVIEEGRLTDPEQREHFVTAVFAFFRWKAVPARVAAIQAHHQQYKLLLMAQSPQHYRRLGGVAANPRRRRPSEIRAEYETLLLEALAKASTTGKRVNVLQHIFGYFKEKLGAREKRDLLEAIEDYRKGELSFLAAVKLHQHVAKRLEIPYLEGQLFFDPYPKALALRRLL
jgi:uncharacterized protein YbbK (DUF523 family)/uncharacterized protein YbgA (DUF1722 family)